MLDRKLRRDLVGLRSQVLSIALVIGAGLGIFIAALGAHLSLRDAVERYYRDTRFANLFVSLERAPDAVARQLNAIPGIGWLETRLVYSALADLPGKPFPVTARVISLPDRPTSLNRLRLLKGQFPRPNATNDIAINQAFADANRLQPGDRLALLLNGKRQELRIAGIVLSPEHVFALPPGSPIADDARYGIVWMNRDAVEAAFDMEDAFNDVIIHTAPGAATSSIMQALDRILDPYGGLSAYDRTEQPSARFISDELAQQRVMATTIPPVFLAVAVFLVSAVMHRLVATQRGQIALLKAMGYENRAIALHYIKFALMIAALGALTGIVLGFFVGRFMIASYQPFFRLPDLRFHLSPWLILAALAISLFAATVGAFRASLAAAKLPPATGMQPSMPTLPFRALSYLTKLYLPPRAMIVFRGLLGRPGRTAVTIAGLALSLPLIVISLFWSDAIDYMLDVQFSLSERADLNVSFTHPLDKAVLYNAARMKGVLIAEPVRAVAARAVAGHHRERTAVAGLDDHSQLRRLLNTDLAAMRLDDVLISQSLAEKLEVETGDDLMLEILEGRRPKQHVRIAATINDVVGRNIYARMETLQGWMREGPTLSGVAIRTSGTDIDRLYQELKLAPYVETITVRSLAIKSFRDNIAGFILTLAAIFTAFSVTIAIGIIHNSARIALQENSWSFAGLRVLGFTNGEVARLLIWEIAVDTVIAIPLGLWLGYWAVRGIIALHTTEMFTVPPIITQQTYAVTTSIALGVSVASIVLIIRHVRRLDVLAALKARE